VNSNVSHNAVDSIPTRVTEMLGIRYPILAFCHSPAVVAEVGRSGGLGVLGTGLHSPEELEAKLEWLDKNAADVPYGIDVLFPAEYVSDDEVALLSQIPTEHRMFLLKVMAELNIPAPTEAGTKMYGGGHVLTHARARELADVALRHPIKVFATALGPTPPDLTTELANRGIKLIGLAGTPEHAASQVKAGAEIVVATGTEAGGHTGEITTMVLTPQVVDRVSVPVLAAGGIGCGRQMAAALALGAEGVWTGSIWLASTEYELPPLLAERLTHASSHDTIRTKTVTGKWMRTLRNPFVEALEAPDAPRPLPTPLQGILVTEALAGALEHQIPAALGTPIGQIVGMMKEIRPTSQIMSDMVAECRKMLGVLGTRRSTPS
jgi:NAD(P)H-dependent flavin oxidoreductase YrpB (nitropropane dioxygenase family)